MLLIILYLLFCIRISNCIFCNDGSNPCGLDNKDSHNAYFLPINGYHCLDAFNGQVICTCPDNSTKRDRPCRICDRDPNPCGVGPNVVACTDINLSFSCLCNDGQGTLFHSTKPCDGSIIKPPGHKCENEGVRDPTNNICNCPSGYSGSNCEIRTDIDLCERIQCMSNGVCAVRPIVDGSKLYQSKCLCRAGYDGEYCEKQNSIGSCTSLYCLNEGVCQQRKIGGTNYVYCYCQPGWVGARCEKQYFRCTKSGYFIDEFMKNQGKYFQCTPINTGYLLEQLSCPKGLKFNLEKKLCLK